MYCIQSKLLSHVMLEKNDEGLEAVEIQLNNVDFDEKFSAFKQQKKKFLIT